MCLLTVCVGGKMSMNVLGQSSLLLVSVQDLLLMRQSSSDMEDLTFKSEYIVGCTRYWATQGQVAAKYN